MKIKQIYFQHILIQN